MLSKSLANKIAQQTKLVNKKAATLEQERKRLKELQKQLEKEISIFWEELKKISAKYMLAILSKQEDSYPGLEEFLGKILVKVKDCNDDRRIGDNYFKTAFLYYTVFNPEENSTSYMRVQNKIECPSVVFVDDPNFESIQELVIRNKKIIDTNNNLSIYSVKWLFLPTLLFFITKKEKNYEDAFNCTNNVFEEIKEKKVDSLKAEEYIAERLYIELIT